MVSKRSALAAFFALIALLLAASPAAAARVRFHYVSSPAGGPMVLAPVAPNASGERISTFGREPYACPPPKATWVASLRHSFTGCTVQVPLGLPFDTPTIEHRTNRVVYNYGSYSVEVIFLADGSVDVIYNSGLFRDI